GAIGVPFEVAESIASTEPVAFAPRLTLSTKIVCAADVGVNGSEMLSVPERGPAAEGVVVTGTEQSKEWSAFCAPQVRVPAAISGVVVRVAAAADTVPALLSLKCAWIVSVCAEPTVSGAK